MIPRPNPKIDTDHAIASLNALLRSEHSAVESYEHAIAKLGVEAPEELSNCLRSHRQRVQRLTVRISALGGEPASSSGIWIALTKLVEDGAAMFTRKSALAIIEEREDQGLTQYGDRLASLDNESRRLVETELLPEQRTTHTTIRSLSLATA